jgi:hypothetical protein
MKNTKDSGIEAYDDTDGFMGKEVDFFDAIFDDNIKSFTMVFGSRDESKQQHKEGRENEKK